MMRVGSALAVVALGLALDHHAAMANPWPKEEGRAEWISSAIVTRQNAGFANGGTANAFSQMHLEYGAWPKLTLIADAGVQQYALGGQSRPLFDTAWLGARAPLHHWDNSLISLEAEAGLSSLRQNASVNAATALSGTGVFRVMYGQGFEVWSRHAFAGAEAGWRWRPGPPSDEFLFDTTVGIEPWPNALVMLQSFTIAATGAARGAYRPYDLVKAQLSLAQRVTAHWWVQAGGIATVAGADSGEAGALFALWWRS